MGVGVGEASDTVGLSWNQAQGPAASQGANAGIREFCLEVFKNGFLMVAVNFLECGAVGDGDFQDAVTDLDGAAVAGKFSADGLLPGIVEHIGGGPFEQSAGADQSLDGVPDGTRKPG